MIVALRERAEQVRRAEIDRHRQRLVGLDSSQLDVVESLTRSILGKILHEPSVSLKEAAGTPRGDRLVTAIRELFALDELPAGGREVAPERDLPSAPT